MKSFSIAKGKDQLAAAFDEALAIDPTLLFIFAAPAILRDEACAALIREKIGARAAVGCSTAGEISNDGLKEGGVSILAVHFDRTTVRTATSPLLGARESFFAGVALGEKLNDPELKAIFLLSPGTNVNGSEVTNGVRSAVGKDVSISGGLAGDEMEFKKTHTLCDAGSYTDHVVAVGFYGPAVAISCGSEGGWRPFGPARRVTKSDGNILKELDGKPALQLYRQYLGEKARQLPASGLSYPIAILRDDRTMSGLIRTALDIDLKEESMIMAGDVPQGSRVCLMHADTDALIQGAAQAAAEALRTHGAPEENGCALLVNCIGRRVILGLDADEEIEAVTDSFLPHTPVAGYYSYGEICSYGKTGRAELHNQTMTITYITEREEP